jgi:hypothetical protein
MFNKHVTAKLSAYCNGELAKEDSQTVAEHLLSCHKCRQAFDEIKLGVILAESLPQISAPDSLWSEIENLLDAQPSTMQTAKSATQSAKIFGHKRLSRFAFNFGWQRLAVASALLIVFFTAASVVWYDANLSNQLEAAKAKVIGNTPIFEIPHLPENTEITSSNQHESAIATTDGGAKTHDASNKNHHKKNDSLVSPPLTNDATNAGSWQVARLAGSPIVGASPLADKGKIAVGEWLETDGASRAQITVGEIGHVEVAPNTRIKLVEARQNEHRLQLAIGEMHAKIYAPPRIFFVDTPTAEAIDLGCEYTLEVDDTGTSTLRVQSGWVAFVCNGFESLVPEGARSVTRKGFAPGTPYFEDATEKFKQAINDFDFAKGGKRALKVLTKEANVRDTLTLWHLLSRVGKTERLRLYNRIVGFVPLPDDVTREGILRLDKEMLRLWKLDLEVEWYAPVKKELK